MRLAEQLAGIDPSVPDALFRRLLYEDELGYLRNENTITGFEVDLEHSVELHGYALIAIQKHTILAFRSDLDEPYKLILFPSMDKLDDASFGLQNLTVRRKVFTNDKFTGTTEKEGLLKDVAKDLIPPYKEVEVDDDMAKAMRSSVRAETLQKKRPKRVTVERNAAPAQPVTHTVPDDVGDAPFEDAPIDSPFDDVPFDDEPFDDDAPVEHPDFDDGPDGFDEFDAVEHEPEIEPEPEIEIEPEKPKEDERAIKLKAQTFEKLHEVKDYATVHLNVRTEIASTVLDAALNKGQALSRQDQIKMAVAILAKVINQGKA